MRSRASNYRRRSFSRRGVGDAAGGGTCASPRTGSQWTYARAGQSPAANGRCVEHECEVRSALAACVRAPPTQVAHGDARQERAQHTGVLVQNTFRSQNSTVTVIIALE